MLLVALAQPGLAGRADPFFTVLAEGDRLAPSVQAKMPIPFRLLGVREGIATHALDLEGSAELLASPTIGILVACNLKSAEVISARIDISDLATGEVTGKYKARPGSILRENRKLEFVKRASSPKGLTSGPQKVSIKICSRIGPDLAAVAQFSEGEPLSRLLWVPATSWKGKSGAASVWGWWERPWSGEAMSKAGLLAYMWGFGADGGRAIFSIILCAAGIWLLGCLCLMNGPWPGLGQTGSVALGAALLFLGSGSVLCLLFPPFHAPDEPNHFLTYAALLHQPALAGDAQRLADGGHFERIKFRTDEKFATSDAGYPVINNWATHVGTTNPNRSPASKIIWLLASHFLSERQAGFALLGLRLVNVFFVAACLAAALALAAWGLRPERLTIFLAAPAILTPAVAFFSMGVSNYPFLVGAYILQAAGAGVLWAQSGRPLENLRVQVAAGALAGSGLVLAICSSDNGVFSIVFWAVLIPAYWFLHALRAGDLHREFLCWRAFFLSYFSSAAAVWVFVGSLAGSYHVLPLVMTKRFEEILSATPLAIAGAQAFVFFGYAIPLVALSAALLGAGWHARGARWLPATRKGAAWLLMIGLAFVLLSKSSRVPDFSSATGPDYIGNILYAFFEGFGPGNPDWLVSQTFWGIFGWLDTPMPALLTNTTRWMAGGGLLALVILSIRKSSFPCGKGFLWANILGLVAMLSFIAAAYPSSDYAVNGRYIIAPYLLILAAAYEGYRRAAALGFPGSNGAWISAASIALVAGAVHGAAWVSILNRYF